MRSDGNSTEIADVYVNALMDGLVLGVLLLSATTNEG